MPRVTLTNSNGIEESNSGGCFGFAGRDNSISSFRNILRDLPRYPITSFKFDLSNQWGDKPQLGLNNPSPYLKWLETGSPWSKYITSVSDTIESNGSFIDIKTDIPGHCVIGTASAARLACNRASTLIPFFNLCMNAGANPNIAFIVFYAIYAQTVTDYTVNEGKIQWKNSPSLKFPSRNSTCSLGLGDDEVMILSEVDPGFLYSFVRGDFELERDDGEDEELYSNGTGYKQQIISSFCSSSSDKVESNFANFLMDRFHPPLYRPSLQKSNTATSMSRSLPAKSFQHPIFLSSLIGWALTLSAEFKIYDKFLGWEKV